MISVIIFNNKAQRNAVLIHILWHETSFDRLIKNCFRYPANVQIEEMNNTMFTFPYLSSCYVIWCIHVVKFIITNLLLTIKHSSSCFDNRLHG